MFPNAIPNLFSSSPKSFPFLLGGIVVSLSSIHFCISLAFRKYAEILFISISFIIFIISSNCSCVKLLLSKIFAFSSSVSASLYGFIRYVLMFLNAPPNLFSSSPKSFPLLLGGFVVPLSSIHFRISLIFFNIIGILSLSIFPIILIISSNCSCVNPFLSKIFAFSS